MSNWHGGKGSAPRPYSVTQEEYDNRWDAIFGRKPATEDTDDEDNEDNELDDEDADTQDGE
jgi:hypothetical protein